MKIDHLVYMMSSDEDLDQMLSDLFEIRDKIHSVLSEHIGCQVIYKNPNMKVDKGFLRKIEYFLITVPAVKQTGTISDKTHNLYNLAKQKVKIFKDLNIINRHFKSKTIDGIRFFGNDALKDCMHSSNISYKHFDDECVSDFDMFVG